MYIIAPDVITRNQTLMIHSTFSFIFFSKSVKFLGVCTFYQHTNLSLFYQSINQSILFLIKRYIINALSAVQWNTHISLNTYIYIYSEIQHTYKHSYKAAISAQIQCFYFRHTHSHSRGRCEQPAPS